MSNTADFLSYQNCNDYEIYPTCVVIKGCSWRSLITLFGRRTRRWGLHLKGWMQNDLFFTTDITLSSILLLIIVFNLHLFHHHRLNWIPNGILPLTKFTVTKSAEHANKTLLSDLMGDDMCLISEPMVNLDKYLNINRSFISLGLCK